jgi:hypothetical protein
MSQKFDRRNFLKVAAGSVAAVAGCAVFANSASAQEHLDPADPTAKALGYLEDAAKTTNASHKAGASCGNCALYQTAAAKAGYAPCGAFGGKYVNEKGWCMAWAPKG